MRYYIPRATINAVILLNQHCMIIGSDFVDKYVVCSCCHFIELNIRSVSEHNKGNRNGHNAFNI